MHRFIALLSIVLLAGCAAQASTYHSHRYYDRQNVEEGDRCGVERWSIKTLADPQAHTLSTTPHDTTVATLVRMATPADKMDLPSRVAPEETTLWRVHAKLIGYKRETDGDYHLILEDPQTGDQMIAEIPWAQCSPPALGNIFTTERTEVEQIGHRAASPERFTYLDRYGAPPIVTIEGFGFVDNEHGQHGAAPNGLELHPVTRISE